MTRRRLRDVAHSARRLGRLAWPVFVGQVSVLAFSTVDTVLMARHSTPDLAALAVGAAAYLTVFIGFMGVVLAVGPIVGRLFGAGEHAAAGRQAHQAVWVALGLSVAGSLLLLVPEPFLALAGATPEVEAGVRAYLLALAVSLPAAMLFSVWRGFNIAVSRPRVVMALQLGGLALKVPLSVALGTGVPSLGLEPLGVLGCGIATAVAMWAQLLLAGWLLRRDPFYDRFRLLGRGLDAPARRDLAAFLTLGLPIGATLLIEVSAFTFMALFISRMGTTAVAGHQIAVNLVSLLFMMPLALASAASTLVAQRIGAGDPQDARRLGGHALLIGCTVAAVFGGTVFAARQNVLRLYTADAAVIAAALPLLAWVALFHLADAAQAVSSFVLRAYRITTVTLVINAAALWGCGLGGGYFLAFGASGSVPASLHGASGFWFAATAGLVLAALALSGTMWRVLRRQDVPAAGAAPARQSPSPSASGA